MKDENFEKLKEELRDEEDLNSLIRAISLAEKHHFTILICETPLQGNAALEVLEEEVAAMRGESVRFLRYAPKKEGKRIDEPITFKQLISQVLEPLYYWKETDEKGLVFVIDASKAGKEDEESWIIFFQRMNEVRNALVERLASPLLLVLPDFLEIEFARRAPDFWSITSACVKAKARIHSPMPEFLDLAATETVEIKAAEKPDIEPLKAKIKWFKDNDFTASRALVILLCRLGDYEMKWGTSVEAKNAYSESVQIMRMLVSHNTERTEWRSDLADSLNKTGDAYMADGDLSQALLLYKEGLEIMRSLLESDPERIEWKHNLSASLEKVGGVYKLQDVFDKALLNYNESLNIKRQLIEISPDRLEFKRGLSVILNKTGDVHIAKGDLSHALLSYKESLEIMRGLLEFSSEHIGWKHDLWISLIKTGDAYMAKSNLNHALSTYKESLVIIRSLLEIDPKRAEWKDNLSINLKKTGEAQKVRGDLDRAVSEITQQRLNAARAGQIVIDIVKSFAIDKGLRQLSASMMGEITKPPEYNIIFVPVAFPDKGGMFDFLDPNSDQEDVRQLRFYGLEQDWQFIPFFVDADANPVGEPVNPEEIDQLDPIELNLPAKTKVVLIAVGPAEELNKVQNSVESGAKEPADNRESRICWVIYGPEIKDLFEEFKKNIIQKADTILDLEEKAKFFKNHKISISKILESLEKDEWIHLGTVLKVLAQESLQAPVPVFGLQPSEKLCTGLKVNEDAIIESMAKFNLWRAKKLQQTAMQKKYAGKYINRHRLLESAIRLAWEQFDPNESWHHAVITEKEACDFIAQCYLFRSRLALAKGSTIPEKKLEALAKAWHWAAEKGYDEMNDLKMEIVLERDRWDKNLSEEWIKDQLNSFPEKEDDSLDFSKPLHWAVNDRARALELISDDRNDRKITDDYNISLIIKNFTDEEKALVSLYQTRATLRMQSDDISERLIKAVAALELSERGTRSKDDSTRYHVPLSHYLWCDIVDLIDKAAEQEELKGKWEDSAVDIWRRCMEEESRVKVGIQIRWYWSKYRLLYQLAFKAALNQNDSELAAEITDSQKSRPTIKALAIEKSLSKKGAEGYKKHVEADALFAAGNFVAGFEALKKIPVPEKEEPRDIMNVPDGWAAVHFNIINENDAHALIVEDKECRHVSIKISCLWDAFNGWVASGRSFGLKKVCKQSGTMLLPVLNKIKSEKILFIPHGFLHLVPLHATELAKERYLFQEKSCLFLPSWSLAPSQDEASVTNGDILLTNWKPDAVKDIVERNDWSNSKRKKNTPDDFFAALKNLHNPPGLLVLYCHGQSDFVNPYNSRFVMEGDNLTHQRLAQDLSVSDLKKSKVILTACESDLVSGRFGLIDEHLSLANAFLSKGASEVLGALFECSPAISLDLIIEAKNNSKKPLYEILQNKQKEWAEKKMPIDEDEIAVFRVMGFPQAGLKEALKTQEDLL